MTAKTARADDVEPSATPETETATYENGEVLDSPTVNAYVVGVEIVEGDQPAPEPPAPGAKG